MGLLDERKARVGNDFVVTHAIRTSNHPVFAVELHSSFQALADGASINAFPGGSSSLIILALLVNYAQTRRSQLMKLPKIISDNFDVFILKPLVEKVR